MTPSRQPDVHLFTTYPPEPILRTFIPPAPFNEDTYDNIQAGIERILEVYKNETEDKASIMDIDQDFGEHNFDETHPTYDSLRYVFTTYEYKSTFTFKTSSKNHQRYMLDDLDRFETEDETAYGTVRVELHRYVDHWWYSFCNPKGPHPIVFTVADQTNKDSEPFTLLLANMNATGDTLFEERPTFRDISDIFTCFAARLSQETTTASYNAHLVFNHLHQLYHDILEVELRQFQRNLILQDVPHQDIQLPPQFLPEIHLQQHVHPPTEPTDNQVNTLDFLNTPSTIDT